jgi:hypothetical protein
MNAARAIVAAHWGAAVRHPPSLGGGAYGAGRRIADPELAGVITTRAVAGHLVATP